MGIRPKTQQEYNLETIKNSDTIFEIEEIDMSTQINKGEKLEDLYGISSKENLVLKAAKSVALKKSKLSKEELCKHLYENYKDDELAKTRNQLFKIGNDYEA